MNFLHKKNDGTHKTVIHVSGIPFFTVDTRAKAGMPSLTRLVQEFVRRDWKVIFIYPDADQLAPFIENGIEFHPVKRIFRGKKANPSFIARQKQRIEPFLIMIALFFKLSLLFKKYSPALLYAHTGIGVLASVPFSKLYRIPLVARLYGFSLPEALINKSILSVKGFLSKLPDAITLSVNANLYVITDDGTYGQQIVQTWGLDNRSLVLRNGIEAPPILGTNDLREFRKKLDLAVTHKLITYVGRLEGWKRPERLIEVARRAKSQQLPWCFTIIGDGELRATLEDMARQYEIEDTVVFIGAVSHDDVWHYLQCSDVFLSLHDLSSISNTLLEALKIGTPVVCSHVGQGLETIVIDGVNGKLVSNPDAPEHVLQLLKEALAIPRKIVAETVNIYSWDKRLEIEFEQIDHLI